MTKEQEINELSKVIQEADPLFTPLGLAEFIINNGYSRQEKLVPNTVTVKVGTIDNGLVPLDEEKLMELFHDLKCPVSAESKIKLKEAICVKFGQEKGLDEIDLQVARETVGFLHRKTISVFPDDTKEIFKERARVIQKLIDICTKAERGN